MKAWRCAAPSDGWAVATVVEHVNGQARFECMQTHLFLPAGEFVRVRTPDHVQRMAFMVELGPDDFATPVEFVPDVLAGDVN